eukprot:jgi/Ulvmu1/392/UM001_0399.1
MLNIRRQSRQEQTPSTDGGAGQPPKPPPPPKATSDASFGGGDENSEQSGFFQWKGWQDRVNADPQFVYKVLVEQFLGVGAAVLGDMSSRPNWGLNELDFVFSTLIVGSLMNFSLMYLLAPTGGAAGRLPGNPFSRLFDERSLTRMGAPGGHIFERGFSLQGRALNLVFKTVMFGVIGFLAGLAGTCISNGLIGVRKMADPQYVSQNETPDVFLNSLAWTLHMGASSNIRYQMLNGMDMVLVGLLPPAVFKAVVVIVRTLNNVVGGISFVTCARICGSQKSGAKEAEPEETKKKGRRGK